ncbi:glutamine--fructose-6-phosphate transaminase (isomerizing) [Candidatus Woesearchaeota archaeon]|nr:glutamine--fructose-6-phosphate transaminase (isomerizing) [Candidatus Woesearchaeota archaeon]
MCGIVGYIGKKSACPILLSGLKRLEYRGYDSSGICVKTKFGLEYVKRKGRILELEDALSSKNFKNCFVGIAHTRWATHGEPTEVNAHPHFDSTGEIAIVHNGIIENYMTLKKMLIAEGIKFVSETDSEVLAHLISKFYEDCNLESAVVKALELVEGTFGLLVMSKTSEKLVAARRGSPLVVGIGEDEMFVSSDVSAILEYTRRVMYLNDDELVVFDAHSYAVKNLKGAVLGKKIHEIKWSIDQIEKGGYKHFMLKEIYEQPTAIENTLRGRIKDNKVWFDFNIDLFGIRRIIITACGTSWHSALIGKYYFERNCEIPVEVDYASEFRYRNPLVTENDLVIAISQSGETADTLAALREAKSKGAKTLGLVNVVGSTIAREVDYVVYLHAGPEIGVASTKAFTTQVIDLLLISLFFRQRLGKKVDSLVLEELQLLPEKVSLMLEQFEKTGTIKKLAEDFKKYSNALYLGRGMNFPVALEGALKLKEISYIHSEGYPAAEMKHGPIALIDKDMPVVFIAPQDHTYEKILSNMEEIKARGGEIIALIDENDSLVSHLTKNTISVMSSIEEISPILDVIPLQLLAYYIADSKGIDVDKPRNLAKSVTVE